MIHPRDHLCVIIGTLFLLAFFPDCCVAYLVAAVYPLVVAVERYYLFYLDQHHPAVLVTRVHQKDKHAVDGVSVGVAIKYDHYPTFFSLQIIESRLQSIHIIRLVGWLRSDLRISDR